MKPLWDVIIAGAGASGTMAGISSGMLGAKTIIIEKNSLPCKKLLLTGKGRCNITNVGDIDNFLRNYNKEGVFLRNVFAKFFNQDAIEFFEDLNITLKRERGGRVFPVSNSARDVVDGLFDRAKNLNVKFLFNSRVKKILISDKNICCGIVLDNEDIILGNAVIIATGGLSYPQTGSTGDGFKIAKELGHNIVPLLPGLVGLQVQEKWPLSLQGLSLKNVQIKAISKGRVISEEFGEMLFTHFGISGPIVLSISNFVIDNLNQNGVIIELNLKPALTCEVLDKRLQREISAYPNLILKNFLKLLLPKKMAEIFPTICNLDETKKVKNLTFEDRKILVRNLQHMKMTVKSTRPIQEAIITRGGVDTKEVNPKTMESKIIKGLYIVGEMLNIDGKTGGYNLQAAFSTGWVAGIEAGKNACGGIR